MLSILSKFMGLFSLSPSKRYKMRYYAIHGLAKRFGFRMYIIGVTWFNDEEFFRIWSESPFYDGHPENIEDKKFTLYQIIKAVSYVRGDTAECGVYKGASSYLILEAIEKLGKTHHAFDSFEGLSEPGLKDKVSGKRIPKWQKHDLTSLEDEVRNNLAGFENLKIYKGWIPERFREISDKRFSFVHIDVDIYQPTYDSLVFFYPRMSPGGIILFDDYGFESCPGVKRACDEYLTGKKERLIHLPTGQGMIIKSQYYD
jgi:hypothetical protein